MSKEIKGCGVVDIDNVTIVVDDATNVISVADGVVAMPIATDTTLGGVIPDGTVITVGEDGAITVPVATDTTLGVVSVDGEIITITEGGEITVAGATTTTLGVVGQATNQADSTATLVADLVTDFNALLDKLKLARLMVADEEE